MKWKNRYQWFIYYIDTDIDVPLIMTSICGLEIKGRIVEKNCIKLITMVSIIITALSFIVPVVNLYNKRLLPLIMELLYISYRIAEIIFHFLFSFVHLTFHNYLRIYNSSVKSNAIGS
jgi:hypothetical protein